ncbi:MAG: DUF367 family protein [Promethearchaeota archaeon]
MKSSYSDKLILKLFCLHYNECDPKKCTAFRLKKFNLLKMIEKDKHYSTKSIILNPLSRKVISANDRELILKYGLIVIDCSWKKLLKISKLESSNYRKLPPLLATNPTNYGKWEKLSSAEAIAAALYITGFKEYGDLILSKFSWGIQFKKLNKF